MVSYEGEDRDWLLTLAGNAVSSIDAISVSDESAFWHTDLGVRYLDAQLEARRNGVEIRRIFISNCPESAADPSFLDACRTQREMGFQIRVLDRAAIPPPLRTEPLNFILFDDIVSYEITVEARPDQSQPAYVANTRLWIHPDALQDRIDQFRGLWEKSAPLAQPPR
jgi:hypothetical protein